MAALLLLGGGLVAAWLGGEKTPFEEMLESSAAARFMTAALATVTAPLVEELVFRGVAYPALQRALARLISLLKLLTAPGGTRLVAETRGAFGRVARPEDVAVGVHGARRQRESRRGRSAAVLQPPGSRGERRAG